MGGQASVVPVVLVCYYAIGLPLCYIFAFRWGLRVRSPWFLRYAPTQRGEEGRAPGNQNAWEHGDVLSTLATNSSTAQHRDCSAYCGTTEDFTGLATTTVYLL